jgi:hypothetical protein
MEELPAARPVAARSPPVEHEPSETAGREKFLAVVLATLVVAAVFFFLIVITGGLIILVIAVAAGMGLLAFINYCLWGRGMSQEVAGEREELELQEKMSLPEWDLPAEE